MNNKEQDMIVLKRILRIFLDHKAKVLLIIICLSIYVGISFFIPFISKMIIDEGILSKNIEIVIYCSIAISFLGLVHAVVNILKERVRIGIYIDAYCRLINDAFQALLNVRITYFDKKNATDMFADLDVDANNILSLFGDSIFFAMTQLVTFIGGLIGLFVIDHRMATVVLIFIPIKYYLVTTLGRKRKVSIEELIKAKTQYAHWFGDALQGIKDIRLFGLSKKWGDDLKDILSPLMLSHKNLAILDSCNISFEYSMIQLLVGVLYGAGAYFILDEKLTLGTLFAFITYSMYVLDPISSLLNIHYSLSGVMPSAHRYYQFISETKKERELSGSKPVNSISTVEFLDVTFFHASAPILQNASFSIKRGEKVAIVGQNGTGKSTILSLIQKFYEPDSGKILINGVNLSEMEKTSFRERISCINQDSYLFDIGILENLRLYKNISDEHLLKALEQSQVSDFYYVKSKLGIGQNGRNLSSGQKQKVLLGRLLLQKGNLYLLDEATANLDSDAEEAIMRLLKTTLKDETVVIVTHKKDLLSFVQKIIYLNGDGSIIVYDSYDRVSMENLDKLPFMQSKSHS